MQRYKSYYTITSGEFTSRYKRNVSSPTLNLTDLPYFKDHFGDQCVKLQQGYVALSQNCSQVRGELVEVEQKSCYVTW